MYIRYISPMEFISPYILFVEKVAKDNGIENPYAVAIIEIPDNINPANPLRRDVTEEVEKMLRGLKGDLNAPVKSVAFKGHELFAKYHWDIIGAQLIKNFKIMFV